MASDYDLYFPNQEVIDPLGSIIINLNSAGAPAYQWIRPMHLRAIGGVSNDIVTAVPFRDAVAYKVRTLDEIPSFYDPLTPIGDTACLTDPVNCSGRGPFMLLGRKYYIDYTFMYFVDRSDPDDDGGIPTFAVDGDCDDNFGHFLGIPRGAPSTRLATVGSLLTSTPAYTSELKSLDDTITYDWTVRQSTSTLVAPTPPSVSNILSLVSNAIEYGNEGVTAKNLGGSNILINAGEFIPVILVRYVSASAAARALKINVRYGYTPDEIIGDPL